MMKGWSLISICGALLGAVSCTPVGSSFPGNGSSPVDGVTPIGTSVGNTGPVGNVGSGERLSLNELRELRETRQAVGNEILLNDGRRPGAELPDQPSSTSYSGEDFLNASDLPPLSPSVVVYRYAVAVPGRPGWVYNPYTNRPIDVRGVESGRLIYDERDPDNRNEDGSLLPVAEMPNKFRVP